MLARLVRPLGPLVRGLSRFRALPVRARRAFAGAGHDPRESYARLMSYFSPEQKTAIYTDGMRELVNNADSFEWTYAFMRESGESLGIRLLQYSDAMTYLPGDILTKVDIASMANGLECRSPMLDHEFVDLVAGMPVDRKMRGMRTKAILKEAFADLLPPAIGARRKMGFGVPLDHWFRSELRGMLDSAQRALQVIDLLFRSLSQTGFVFFSALPLFVGLISLFSRSLSS